MPSTDALIAAIALALLCSTGGAPVAAGPLAGVDGVGAAGPSGEVLVVDAGGDAGYTSIGAALADAQDGDTVRVRPGTYGESITLDANVTLVAPRGATLEGTDVESDRGIVIEAGSHAKPVVDGIDVVGFPFGIDASETAGDWTLRNCTVRSADFKGVRAGFSTGDWTIRNLTIENSTRGIDSHHAEGDWVVEDTVVRDADHFGVGAVGAPGNWTLRDTVVIRTKGAGVNALGTAGDWLVANATVQTAAIGVVAAGSSGDWTVRDSVVADPVTRGYLLPPPRLEEGVGIYARDTNGSWTVVGTRLVDTERGAIVAPGADPTGDAVDNPWGGGGPDVDDCRGNVDCGGLSSETADGPGEEPAVTASETSTASTATGSASGSAETSGDSADHTRADRQTPSSGGDHRWGVLAAIAATLLVASLAAIGVRSRS